MAEERISELEDISIEPLRTKNQKEQRLKKKKKNNIQVLPENGFTSWVSSQNTQPSQKLGERRFITCSK